MVLLASFLVYIISFFLMLALSRYREFAADRGAAVITGRPSALSSALVKISGAMETVPTQDLREAERMNAFFIVPTSVKGAVQTLFSTHPPMEKRIERLQQLEAQLQGTRLAVGFLDALLGGKKKLAAARARPPVRHDHGLRDAGDAALGIKQPRLGGDRLPAARHRRLRGNPHRDARSCCAAPPRRPAPRSSSPRTSSATAG